MRLHHLHLRNPIGYAHSLRLQEALLEQHFSHKTSLRNNVSSSVTHPPSPTLITFQSKPTYTVGRRHFRDNPLSASQIKFLVGRKEDSTTDGKEDDGSLEQQQPVSSDLATFFPSPRGGLLTYHAPGQLTAYLVLDLRTHALTPRCYIRLLENVVMRTCAQHGVPNVTKTDDPGVWITGDRKLAPFADPTKSHVTDRKICAVGVHVSRGITSHGIGLNVFDSPINHADRTKNTYYMADQNRSESTTLAPGFLSWGFSRIVACGLEGKSVTWLTREWTSESLLSGISPTEIGDELMRIPTQDNLMHSVAGTLAVETARALKIGDGNIDAIFEGDVLSPAGDVVDTAQRKRDWSFLKSLPGKIEDQRPERDEKGYNIRRIRDDVGMRFN